MTTQTPASNSEARKRAQEREAAKAAEYAPTTEEVRTDYVMAYADRDSSLLMAGIAFDRWLAAHDAEVAERAKAEERSRIAEAIEGLVEAKGRIVPVPPEAAASGGDDLTDVIERVLRESFDIDYVPAGFMAAEITAAITEHAEAVVEEWGYRVKGSDLVVTVGSEETARRQAQHRGDDWPAVSRTIIRFPWKDVTTDEH